MARAEINGIGIEYELIGTGRAISITPGGRFSKDYPGVRELAEALAAAQRGEGLFANWPKLAPQILRFAGSITR